MTARDDTKLEIAQALCAHPNHVCLDLVYIDLDRFIYHNDAFGHISGDGALNKVSTALSDLSNKLSAHVRRIGGDEFVMYSITDSVNRHIELGKRAQNAIHELGIPLVSEGYRDGNISFPNHITCSVAAVSFPIQSIGRAHRPQDDIKMKADIIEGLLSMLDSMLWLSKCVHTANFVELNLCK